MTGRVSRRSILGAGVAVAGGLLLGVHVRAADAAKRRVVVWSEGTAPKNIYPKDINTAVAEGLQKDLDGWDVVIANLSDAEQGMSAERLASTDVLIWWGHQRHGQVKKALTQAIAKRVKEEGMGFIALHSSHFAEPNKAIMGTRCSWGAYLGDSTELKVIVKEPDHPIAKGVKDFVIPHHERYNNPYAVPKPEALVFDGVYTMKDGSTSPSQQGFCWTIGKAKMFYFQPGHETDPVFFDPNVKLIMKNAVLWAAPAK